MQAWHQRLSGTFEFEVDGVIAATLLVSEGRPAKARTAVPHYLVNVLEELGVLNDVQVEHYLPRLLATTELHGIGLVRRGILTQSQVDLGLRAQLVLQVQTVLEFAPETAFRFYNGKDALGDYGPESEIRLDPFPFVWASLRNQPPRAHIDTALERIGDRYIRALDADEAARFGFDPASQSMVDLLLRKGWRLPDLAAAVQAPETDAQLVVYSLVLAKQVDFAAEPGPSVVDLEEVAGASGDEERDSWLEAEPDSVAEPLSEIVVASARVIDPRAEPMSDRTPTPEAVDVAPAAPPEPPPPASLPSSARPTPVAEEPPTEDATVSGVVTDTEELEEPTVAAPHVSAAAWESFAESEREATPPPEPVPPPVAAAAPRVAPAPAPVVAPAPKPKSDPPPAPAPEVFESDRRTAAPPPDYMEGVPPSFAAKPPPVMHAVEEDLDAFTRQTVPRMTAVTPAEVAAYIASQEAQEKAKQALPKPPPKVPVLPRPPTPGMFAPILPRVGQAAGFAPRIPRSPTAGSFGTTPRPAGVTVGVPAAPPTARVVDVHGHVTPGEFASPVRPPIVAKPAVPKRDAAKPATAAALPDDITDILKRFTGAGPDSSRKTLEFRVDRELMKAAMGVVVSRESGVPATAPAAEAPSSSRNTVELDADWGSLVGPDEPFADGATVEVSNARSGGAGASAPKKDK